MTSRLKIIKEVDPILYRNKHIRVVLCECVCGKKKEIRLYNIHSGKTKSCGCYRSELAGKLKLTHGKVYSPLYSVWGNMKDRCQNPKNKHYKDYGGRGIHICKRWNNFALFYKDMYPSYRPDLTLDRTNNNKGYCKSNCKWVSQQQQVLNMRNNIKYRGECSSEASRRLGGCTILVAQRIRLGWSKKKAFTTPKNK